MFKKDSSLIKERGLYAVTKGPRIGSFYLLLGQVGPKYTFSELPDFKTVVLDEKDVKIGIEGGVLDLVKVLDKRTYEQTTKEHYGRERKTTNHK